MRIILAFLLVGVITKAQFGDYRLPEAVSPTDYELRILTLLNDDENLQFEGAISIKLLVLQNTRNITLHSKNLAIEAKFIDLRHFATNLPICINFTELNQKYDFFIIHLCEHLEANDTYYLTIQFVSNLNRDSIGYLLNSYKTAANKTRWFSITHFERDGARLAFPCFDEPHLKANFTITLGHHKRYQALSNMPLIATRLHSHLKDYIWSDFMTTPPMSTYLVGFTVHDFVHRSAIQNSSDQIEFNIWARPDAIDRYEYAAQIGPVFLRYFEELYGIRFPLPKIDIIAVDSIKSGGMENWGLIIMNEIYTLYDAKRSSLQAKEDVACTIAHELSHSWYGNLVTMKSWSQLWLKEGFATYTSRSAMEHVQPEWNFMNKYTLRDMFVVHQLDAFETSYPITGDSVQKATEKSQMITYGKTSILIRMLHTFIGEKAFNIGIRDYLRKYSFSNADQDDIWQELTQAAHKTGNLSTHWNLKVMMNTWFMEPGYPILTIKRNYNKHTVSISQKRFLLYAERKPKNSCWWLPLTYTTQKKPNFNATTPKDWLQCSEPVVPTETKVIKHMPGRNQWVIFNIQLTVLCRINYDELNWKLIIKTLTDGDFESIHELNRIQLIDDALSLAWVGELEYEIALQLTTYLKRERAHLPWQTAMNHLNKINRILKLRPAYTLFKVFMQRLLTPIYKHVQGLDDTFAQLTLPNDIQAKAKVVSWACQYDMDDCLFNAFKYYSIWRCEPNPDNVNRIPLEMRDTVYCTALRHGTAADWRFLWSRLKNSNESTERTVISKALGCTHDRQQLQHYIELIFNNSVELAEQDLLPILMTIVDNMHGLPLFLNYMELHDKKIEDLSIISELSNHLAEQVTKPNDVKKLIELLIRSGPATAGIMNGFQTARQMTLQWLSTKKVKFFHGLVDHNLKTKLHKLALRN